MSIVVTGGSGYLGQFLVTGLAETHKVNLADGSGLLECLELAAPVLAVVNCAAIAQPAACAKDPALARSINVPHKLLEALVSIRAKSNVEPLLIQLSTDQVYDGSKAMWREGDPCEPVNVYGKTKLEAEQLIQEVWPHHVILRSSIIFGPEPPQAIGRSTFLNFLDTSLASGTPITVFDDEFRNFVYVGDILAAVRQLVDHEGPPPHRLINLGGPERLSRLEFALKVAEVRGCDPALLVPGSSASVQRPVASPQDISMDVTCLVEGLGVHLTPTSEALRRIFAGQQK